MLVEKRSYTEGQAYDQRRKSPWQMQRDFRDAVKRGGRFVAFPINPLARQFFLNGAWHFKAA